MSTVLETPPRVLFAGLVDDAAVFPPGSFTLPDAVSRVAARRSRSYADLVGPLLLPPALIPEALEQPTPLTISVVGRPDVPLADSLDATRQVLASDRHTLAGLEIGYVSAWRDALEPGVPLAVEISHDDADGPAVADLAEDGLAQVRAKLRTGSTVTNPVPSPERLSQFLATTISRGLAFKLTGGMHRAVSHRAGTPDGGEDQFGFLNVLLATDQLLRGGSVGDACTLLSQDDSGAVAMLAASLDRARCAAIRTSFHSYGCCDVLDPIQDLSALNLIEETP